MEVQVYKHLFESISETYTNGKVKAFNAANIALVETYWKIGQDIVEFEQGGKTKAEYGTSLLESLSRDLSWKFGRGFSLSNLQRFRQFFIAYPIHATVSHELDSAENETLAKSAREKDELQIRYAMSHTNSKLFVQKYQLYLPNEEELRKEIEMVYQQEKEE